MFLCNIGRNHWVSVVVVNPFLISGPFLKGDDESATMILMKIHWTMTCVGGVFLTH